MAAEILRPMNQGLQSIGSATPFRVLVEGDYRDAALPLLGRSTQKNYKQILRSRLLPEFGDAPLKDLTTRRLQSYFSNLDVNYPNAVKIRDALASVLTSAVRFELLTKNPLTGVRVPTSRKVSRTKLTITPEQFEKLIDLLPEPFATMIFVCVLAGLRVSELIGLKWEDLGEDSITIDERFSRGGWGESKTPASAATIAVDPRVIERIHQLKGKEITINWGARGARKTFQLVRSSEPGDLVFQSLTKGSPMSDQNVLRRHIKPVARMLGIPGLNWQVLRRSYATWLVQSGADVKSVQGQMRHTDPKLAMLVYAQVVPASQRKAVTQMMDMLDSRRVPVNVQ